jgi:hypothetical protein
MGGSRQSGSLTAENLADTALWILDLYASFSSLSHLQPFKRIDYIRDDRNVRGYEIHHLTRNTSMELCPTFSPIPLGYLTRSYLYREATSGHSMATSPTLLAPRGEVVQLVSTQMDACHLRRTVQVKFLLFILSRFPGGQGWPWRRPGDLE